MSVDVVSPGGEQITERASSAIGSHVIDKAVLIASVVSGVLLHAICPFARDTVAVRARESRL